MIKLKNKKLQNAIVFVLLCIGGSVVYYVSGRMRGLFYVPMQNATGFTNTQIGNLASLYGTISVLAYFPGGWLADKFTARKLLTFSYLTCGILTLWFSVYPSYEVCLIIYACFGICNTLTFWAAMLKATRELGGNKSQGKSFGGLEGGRGVVVSVLALLAVVLFKTMASETAGLRVTIIIYGILCFVTAIGTWLFFPNTKSEKSDNPFKGLIEALKNPSTWYISLIVLCIYATSAGISYLTPYANKVFMVSVSIAAIIGTLREWVRPVGAIGGGFIADKIGITKAMIIFIALMGVSNGAFALIPGNTSLIVFFVANTICVYILIGLLRGLYFANLNEGGIPAHLTGTVMGFASAIGFTADIWLPKMVGPWLDKYPSESPLPYQYLFGILAALCFIGMILLIMFDKHNKNRRAKEDNAL